jgi:cytochrome c-type biogenesis protein CcmH/NrfG
MCQAHLGRHTEAVAALEQAANLQPMNPHAWYALGMAHHAVHSPDKVKAVTLHLVRFDPRMARRLIHDAERADLNYLVKDLVV